MEKFPRPSSENVSESNRVEKEANFEGNETEILISRLREPVIKRQIAEIISHEDTKYYNSLMNEEWEPHLPEGWTGEEKFKLLKGMHGGRIIDTEDLKIVLNTKAPKTIDEIEKELDKDIDEVASVTKINYTSDQPSASVIPLNWIVPWTGEKPTTKQMSIIEAHEKGHRIRYYDGSTEYFRKGFDISKVQFTKVDSEIFKRDWENHTNKSEDFDKEMTLEEEREKYLNGYLFTGVEIAERMSQLKNYFGFSGDEKFTKEHLSYAKENYIKDTNMDNGMRMFFEGITPETEQTFLELINNSGI